MLRGQVAKVLASAIQEGAGDGANRRCLRTAQAITRGASNQDERVNGKRDKACILEINAA